MDRGAGRGKDLGLPGEQTCMSSVAAPLAGPSARAGSARPAADIPAVVSTVAWAGLCALIVAAPFEALEPVVTIPGQSLSSLEVVMVAILGGWAMGLASSRTLPIWRTPLTLPWLGFVLTMLAAALLAQSHRGNALNMVGRLALGFAIYTLTVNAVNSTRRLMGACVAVGVSAAVVWPLLLLEHAEVGWVGGLLSAFRSHSANVGAALRASGPFLYPTIASMYLEIAFALTLGTFLTLADRRHYGRAIWSALLLFVIGQSITLTSSRAGLALMVASIAVVSALRVKRVGFDLCGKTLLALLALIAFQVPTIHSFENLALRLTTESQDAWYRASFEAPREISIATGETILVPIRVTNTGRTVWNSAVTPPFRLSYHLLLEDDRVSSWQGLRTDFPDPVQPGDSISLNAAVEAPMKPGRYRVMWDIERENWLWFSTEPGAALFVTDAVVTGPEIGPTGQPYEAKLPTAPRRQGRLLLWRAALGMFAANPVSGVGPDNFRLEYGAYAGLADFDTRVHSNNMYLEVLAGGGLIAIAMFAWLCVAASSLVIRAVKIADGRTASLASGIATAVAAIALHGAVDSFLSFTPTYVLIAVTLGLASSSLSLNRTHAHRI